MLVDLVNVVVRVDGAAVCISVYCWEVEGALALVVFRCNKTGDNGRCAPWCSILPVGKRLVAKHPVPLSVGGDSGGVVDVRVAEDVVGRIVAIQT